MDTLEIFYYLDIDRHELKQHKTEVPIPGNWYWCPKGIDYREVVQYSGKVEMIEVSEFLGQTRYIN